MEQTVDHRDAEDVAAALMDQVRSGVASPTEALRKILALADRHQLDLADDLDVQGTGVMNTQDLPPIDKAAFLALQDTSETGATEESDQEVLAATVAESRPAVSGVYSQVGAPPMRADAVLGQLNWYVRDILFLQFRRINLFHREGETYEWDVLAEQVGLAGHRRELFDAVIRFLVKHEMLSVSESAGLPVTVRAGTNSESVRKRLANLNLYHRKLLSDYPETAPLFRVLRACIEGFGDMLLRPSVSGETEPVSPRAATLRMFAMREVGE